MNILNSIGDRDRKRKAACLQFHEEAVRALTSWSAECADDAILKLIEGAPSAPLPIVSRIPQLSLHRETTQTQGTQLTADEPMDCFAAQEADTQQLDEVPPRTPHQEAIETDLDATDNSKKRARAASFEEETHPQEPRPRVDLLSGGSEGHFESGDNPKSGGDNDDSHHNQEGETHQPIESQPISQEEAKDGHGADQDHKKDSQVASLEVTKSSAEGHCDNGNTMNSVGDDHGSHESHASTDHHQKEAEHTQNPAVVDRILSADSGEDTPFKSQDDREASMVQKWLNGDAKGDGDSHRSELDNIDSHHSAVHSHA